MKYQRIGPSKALAHLIDFHEVVEVNIPDPHFAFLSFNHPAEQGISIFYRLDGEGLHQRTGQQKGISYQEGKIYIQSVSSAGTVHRIRGEIGYLRTFFKPGKLEPFLGKSVQDTTDRLLTLSEFHTARASRLEDRIMNSKLLTERIQLLEGHLQHQFRWASREKELIQFLTEAIQKGRTFRTVSDLTGFFGYSARHLQRIFLDQIGIAPKGFLKMFRLKQVLKALESKTFDSLTHLAYDFGFSDQAHLCREFKAYMGLSPGKYLKRIDPSFANRNQLEFQGWVGEMKE